MGILKNEDMPRSLAQTPTNVGGFNAILDRGSEFEGKLTFQGTVRIDGKFKGEVFSKSHIVIGESGEVEGSANIGSISISGHFKGDITAKEKVELHPSAVVDGDITTPSLIIEEGVTFNGRAIMETGKTKKIQSSDPLAQKTDAKPAITPANA